MFVCVCNGVTEGQIRDAVTDGVSSLSELCARLGVASGCGTCVDCARQVLHETLQTASVAETRCAA
jgi:bacterioferritin-associated ferredoxin